MSHYVFSLCACIDASAYLVAHGDPARLSFPATRTRGVQLDLEDQVLTLPTDLCQTDSTPDRFTEEQTYWETYKITATCDYLSIQIEFV